MRRHEESPLEKAVLLKRTRKFASSFLDFLCLFLLTLILFAISDAILSNLSFYKAKQDEAFKHQEELYRIVEESGISKREEGYLLSSETMAENVLKANVLKVLRENKAEEEISVQVYGNVESITPEKDGLYFYYVDFKAKQEESFLAESREEKGLSYYLEEVLHIDETDFFEVDGDYPYLEKETAFAIDEYYVSGTAYGKRIHDDILETYVSGNNMAREDISTNYVPYKTEEDAFLLAKDSLLLMRGNTILLSYFLSILIVYLLFPLLFHDGRTLAEKAMDIGYTDIEGRKVGVFQIVVRLLLSLVAFLVVPFLSAMILFGGEGIAFMDVHLLGFYNILVGAIVSVLYLLVSGLFSLWQRGKIHQTLTELLSLSLSRNGKEFLVEEEKNG